jgi:putative DNA primase/helicase
MNSGYGDVVHAYRKAGWKGVLPLPPGQKFPPPDGYTGKEGRWPTDDDISTWRLKFPGHNVCLRLDHDIVGVDLDVYKEPDVRERLEEFFGCALPPTWHSSSRDDGSGIFLFRVSLPPGKRWKSNPVPGCEIVQFDHRYAVVAKSTHPEGRRYHWRDDAGELTTGPPTRADLADLPPQAAEALLEDDQDYESRDPVEFGLTDGAPDLRVEALHGEALDACSGDGGTRHDRVMKPVMGIIRAAEQGEPGTRDAIETIGERFVASVAPDRPGGEREARREFDSMVNDAWVKVGTTEPPAGSTGIVVTDLANSRRLVERHGDDLLYVPRMGRWFVWDGRRFAEDNTGEAERRAKSVVIHLADLLREVKGDDKRKTLFRDWLKSQHASRIEGMLKLTRSEPGIPVDVSELDADPWMVNLENGVLDLSARELLPHDRVYRITKLAPVRYDPDADAPTFRAFLERVLPDQNIRAYAMRVLSMGLTGDTSEQRLPIANGEGANGKSTLLGAVRGALGDYACQLAPETLMATKYSQHPTSLMDLRGARLAVSVEVEEGRRLAESLVKQLTGGTDEPVVARYMHQNFVSFEPTHTIVLVCNHLPVVWGTDHAIWRRLAVIPFDVRIPDDEQDKDLPAKLAAERPGILNRLLDGFADWRANGLNPPDAVAARTAQYRREQDVLDGFLTACCDIGAGYTVDAKDLRDAYEEWCDSSGIEPLGKTAFGRRLAERYPKSRDCRSRSGLRLQRGAPGSLDGLA